MNLMLKANFEFNNGNLEISKRILHEILSLDYRNIEALQLLGIIYAVETNFIKSIDTFTKAINHNPLIAQLYFNRGNALIESGNHEEAAKDFEKSLLLDGNDIRTLVAYGNACKHSGQIEKALNNYESALKINPQFYEALTNIAILQNEIGNLDAAIFHLEKAISIEPNLPYAYFNLGVIFQSLNRLNEALLNYNKAIYINPRYIDAYNNRGNTLRELGLLDEAVLCFKDLLAISPKNIDAYNNLGIVYDQMKDHYEAIHNYDLAISIDPTFVNAYVNKGNTLRKLRLLIQAIDCFKYALLLSNNNPEVCISIGNCLKELKRFDEAIKFYDKAISLNTNFAEAYFNKSLVYLLLGKFAEGWQLYEWRWKQKNFFSPVRNLSKIKLWDGSKLSGTLLVLPEQGVGDEILFLGIIGEVKKLVERLVVVVDKRLIPLCVRSFEDILFISSYSLDETFECDAQIYMGSLGRYFRNEAKCFQNVKVGYLIANSKETSEYRSKFLLHKKTICGLSWASSNKEFGGNKSIRLIDMYPLLVQNDFHFVNLQYGDTYIERQSLFENTGISIDDSQDIDKFNDLDGLASLISACDVVVTISNTTAHLAASLGKLVFVIIPEGYGLLHYWQVERIDTPWYPTVKLYRQKIIGSFEEVLFRISDDLKKYHSYNFSY